MTWLWKKLADMPSTNARIFMTLIVFGGTAIKYWYTNKAPDNNWLIFISVMAGVDALQFGAKRATEKPTPPLGKDQEDTAGVPVPPKTLADVTLDRIDPTPPELRERVRTDEIP
jgi:hypothetical protein